MESYSHQSATKLLKKNAVDRILINMIEDIKIGDPSARRADIPFLLLVLDEYTAKLISSFVTMSDVLNKGIFSVEKLEIGRQKFPNYQAIYFISPTKSSIDYILKDFEDKQNPQYKRIHIFFSHAVMDSSLSLLANEKVYPRILSCKELNLSFLCKNRNLFELGISNFLEIFSAKADKDKERDKIATLSERLFTVCSVLNEFPFIQYQKSSNFCYELALSLNAKLKDFYGSGCDVNTTRGLMLITDRSLDVCTPLLHDYSYESLLYDLLRPEEFVVKSNDEKAQPRRMELDENDEIWNKYKNCHIAEVFEKMSREASDFCNLIKSKDKGKDGSGKGGDKSYKEFDEMRQVLREAKSLKAKSDVFNFHIESCQTMGSRLKEYDVSNLIDYEQDIITGVNKQGDKINNKDIFTKFTTLNLNKKELEIKTRIITTIMLNLDLSEMELNRLTENNPHIKKVVENLFWFGISVSNNKGKGRREPVKSKQEIKKIKEKNNEMDLVGLRSNPKLETLVENWSNLDLSSTEYPFMEEPKNLGVYRKKIVTGVFFNNANSDEEKPNFILFNIGGLSHNEISAIEKLVQDKKVTQNLIIGTDKIVTANEYVSAIKNLPPQSLDSTEIELRYK